MSGWNDTTAGGDDGGAWKADSGAGIGGWAPDQTADGGDGDQGFTISGDNISKHHDGPADGGCRNCGEDGHFSRDCPEERKECGNSSLCYNCNEPGHNASDCVNLRVEREFTGECRICSKSGHRAADCPDKAPDVCKICRNEDHATSECGANRLFMAYKVTADLTPEDAWTALETADKAKDVDDIKSAILQYAKAYPELSFQELEATFRDANFNTHLIAKQQEISVTHTIVNFQGEKDQKFTVSIQWFAEPRRLKFKEGWPANPDENRERLAEAGFIMDGFVTKCSNCDQVGHSRSSCTEEKRETLKHVETCVLCNNEGHRARDCPEPRKTQSGRGCRNCGQEGHISKECPEPPNLDNVECNNCSQTGHFSRDCPNREPDLCRNCGEEGHRAKECEKERVIKCRNCDGEGHMLRDCPEPRNMAKVQCRNCDEFGHTGRDCPKPTDWSRVECSDCKEKGHSYKRCPNPADVAEEGGDGGW